MKKLIYCVEDDSHIAELIKYNLETAGYSVKTFTTGEDLLLANKTKLPDLYLLDIMLPGIDGLQICQQLKSAALTQHLPIILLTAKSEEFDKVLGLELGADDYITKPFSVREMLARVKALFRRSEISPPASEANIITYQSFSLDLEKHQLFKHDQPISLTLKEFKLFELLLKNKGKVMTRELLLEKIWGYEYIGETRTVDVHVRYLRQKIEDDDTHPKYIETIRGIGYKLKEYI